jgi:hypothetical protein
MPIHLLECPHPQHLMTPSFYDGAQESVDTQDVTQARYSAAAAATLQQMLAQHRPQEHSHWRGKQTHRIRGSMQLFHFLFEVDSSQVIEFWIRFDVEENSSSHAAALGRRCLTRRARIQSCIQTNRTRPSLDGRIGTYCSVFI